MHKHIPHTYKHMRGVAEREGEGGREGGGGRDREINRHTETDTEKLRVGNRP